MYATCARFASVIVTAIVRDRKSHYPCRSIMTDKCIRRLTTAGSNIVIETRQMSHPFHFQMGTSSR